MEDVRNRYPGQARSREVVRTATLLGQVMFLVGVAVAFTVAGSYIGRDLGQGTAFMLFVVAFGMLIAQSFVERLRVGTFAIRLAVGVFVSIVNILLSLLNIFGD